MDPEAILANYATSRLGLTHKESAKRLKKYGQNKTQNRKVNLITILLRQFVVNPLILILIFCTSVSFFLGDKITSFYIFGTILISVLLGLINEYSAQRTVERLLKNISKSALVVRGGEKKEIPTTDLTIGDVVILSEGSVVPADLELIEVNNLEVDESVLTGESIPLYKNPGDYSFMGTSVQSGSAQGVVAKIGKNTDYGKIARAASFIKPETSFQKGLREFGGLIVKIVIVMTTVILVVNILIGHRILESVLFALAIAVGITPELLPVVVTVSLSYGAGKLLKKHVVAKQLNSIENLGNMDVLCSDKTGTLTEGKLTVAEILPEDSLHKETLLKYALICNSAINHHRTIGNNIDASLWAHANKIKLKLDSKINIETIKPFDYGRRLMYSSFREGGRNYLVAKGSPESVISTFGPNQNKNPFHDKFIKLSEEGYRVIGISVKEIGGNESPSWDGLYNMKFMGFITFFDKPRLDAKEALNQLKRLSVDLKLITGDNELVTLKVCQEVGLEVSQLVLGSSIDGYSNEEFRKIVTKANVFARVNPQQKLRILQTLKDLGHTVGFLGDGINDILALHNADVGICVNSAVDVAKESASIVLLNKGLDVIAEGIVEGRKIFNNTIKYILMSVSSNFGNMFSAAGASFFLPFLPMTPLQILLTNSLYDVSQMSLPSDNVDQESLVKPRHWNINFIKNYMLFFGPISSIFDFAIFGVLIYFFKAQQKLFQTGWFIESLATEILVVFVIRTARTPFFKSPPGKWVIITCLGVVVAGFILPFTSLATHLGLIRPPNLLLAIIFILITIYLLMMELLKTLFLKRYTL